MKLMIPTKKQDMIRLDGLLQTFETAAKKVGLDYKESQSEERQLDFGSMSYIHPRFAIISRGEKIVAKYLHSYDICDGGREKWITSECEHGIRLHTPHSTTELVRPTYSSVLEIEDEDLLLNFMIFFDIINFYIIINNILFIIS
ncbi:MAG: hypothetical protein KKD48_03920 [Nanoarchaeota archaeon]|nr:hypothetical protein [Nanoarchaeota archaeon]